MHLRLIPVALALLATPHIAMAAGDMSAAEFLTRAEKLKAKGAMALFSGEMKVLKREGEAAGDVYRQKLKADKAAGRAPHSCPPAKASMNSDELLSHLASYPAARRASTSMTTAFADLMKKKYPCS